MPKQKYALHLAKSDPKLAPIIARVKLKPLRKGTNHFRSLAEAIMSQQLSGKAADTIITRVRALFPKKDFPGPKDILKISEEKLRSAGLSGMKVSFLKDLSRRTLDGSLDLKNIHTMDDETVIEHLCVVKGIGRWTAEMFLMFALARPDVFSHGDLGLKNGIKKLYKLREHASLSRAEKIAEKWKPYRTYAARYLWRSNDLE